MNNVFYQCCYTNLSHDVGDTSNAGWQTTAVSSDIPAEAYSACNTLQGANSAIAKEMADAYGKIKSYEISSDGNFLYLTRCQFGLLDMRGRANMFAHSFCFPLTNDIISDPNSFLGVSDDNFKGDVSEASVIPTSLSKDDPFSIESAMEQAAINKELLITLIHCVFAQMSENRVQKPLYVQYDGREITVKALLYCIYKGLPYYLRRKLSAEIMTCNSASKKNLIFTTNAEKFEQYVIPQTGENSILTNRIINKINRYKFVDFAVNFYLYDRLDEYFKRLENAAIQLGDATASDERIIKIAHIHLTSPEVTELDNEELEQRTTDALQAKSSQSKVMEKYIVALLRETMQRNLFLSSENESLLNNRLSNSITQQLADVGEQYNIYCFATLSKEKAAQKLSEMSGGFFETFSHKLAMDRKGTDILDYYFSVVRLENDTPSWEMLEAVWHESSYLSTRPLTENRVSDLAWKTYVEQLKTNAVFAINSYVHLLEQMVKPSELGQCKTAAIEAYWEQVSLCEIKGENEDEYRYFNHPEIPKSVIINCVLDGIAEFDGEHYSPFLISLNQKVKRVIKTLSAQEQQNITDFIVERSKIKSPRATKRNIKEWVVIALHANPETLETCLQMRRSVRPDQYDKLYELSRNLDSVLQLSETRKLICDAIAKILLDVCTENEQRGDIVPLDAWLSIGFISTGGNPFLVFDNEKPRIIEQPAESTVADSRLMKMQYIKDSARSYIREKGTEAKTVKKWLSACEGSGASAPVVESMRNKLSSLFSKNSEEKNSETKPEKKGKKK